MLVGEHLEKRNRLLFMGIYAVGGRLIWASARCKPSCDISEMFASLAQGEWTCTVADFKETMNGPMTMPDGTVIQPTNKSFHIDFCTVARWNEQGQIVEENLFTISWVC